LSEVILLLHVFVLFPFSISNKMTSPVDVGDLPNHVKYCVSVLTLHLSNYQNTTGPRMGRQNPNNWYQSTWFKGVFDFAQK
jgi:hypothetical protein